MNDIAYKCDLGRLQECGEDWAIPITFFGAKSIIRFTLMTLRRKSLVIGSGLRRNQFTRRNRRRISSLT